MLLNQFFFGRPIFMFSFEELFFFSVLDELRYVYLDLLFFYYEQGVTNKTPVSDKLTLSLFLPFTLDNVFEICCWLRIVCVVGA